MKRLRIVILGMMGRCPYGGQTWLYLNWLRAFSRLGHEVWYVEDDTVWPYHPELNMVSDDCGYATRHIASSMEKIGLANQWAYRLADREGACWGMDVTKLDELYRDCDVLLNIVGSTDLRDEHRKAKLRVYVETDPVTAELRLAEGDEHTRLAFADHHAIVTYGENYGNADCGVPTCGINFKKTRQPIDLELWRMVFNPEAEHFTTIGNYKQSGSDVVYKGQTYHWSKHHEWEKVIDLPRRTKQTFRLAMWPEEKDRQRLESFGWQLTPALEMSLDVFGGYRDFFQKSRGEFTVAKDQNVRMRSGWFSERDACYLASGKPVIAQDTAFGCAIPTGEGLFAFRKMDEILAALDSINSDYKRHCKKARELAMEYLDAPRLGAKLLADVGL
ncbi:MAG TPA: hypothetical protein VF669_10165 [Tepidisphaeraceae bacterium]